MFMEDDVHLLLSCTKETNLCSQDMYDTLFPLFNVGQSHVESKEAQIQPIQVFNQSIDQPIIDADVCDALDEERTEIEESMTMPKWLVKTLHDSKLDAPLSTCTCFGSQHVSYASDCYALAVASLCDEEELVLFDEAQNSKKLDGCNAK